jgi:nucleotide-binding universal stress UspA family protein
MSARASSGPTPSIASPIGPGPVLVGVDHRPPAEAAVAVAAELAAHLGRELVIATVYEGGGWLNRSDGPAEADRRAAAEERLWRSRAVAAPYGPELRLRAHRDGAPPTGLREIAAEEQPSLLVLGTSHRRERTAGGTPQSLLADCTCPVLVVPPGAAPPAGRPVAVGCAGSPGADAALAVAAAVAAPLGSPLLIWHAHIESRRAGEPGPAEMRDPLHSAGARILDRARTKAPDGLPVATENLVGAPAGRLAERAREVGAGLLVVGARGYGGGSGLGRTADLLALDPPCPLMVVPQVCRSGAVGAATR